MVDDEDNCVNNFNPNQVDRDDDGRGNECDNCPDTANFNQLDEDNDGIGDVCEADDFDDDGVPNDIDNCPHLVNDQTDTDNDGFGDRCDNCPILENADQLDTDGDGAGDLCDDALDRIIVTLEWPAGDIDMDLHVVHPRGTYDSSLDCYHSNRAPTWCSPGLDQDSRGGDQGGREEIRMTDPESGLYTVGVELYSGSSNATLTFQCGENRFIFGPRPLEEIEDSRPMWEVLQFNPADCSVVRIDQVHPLECRFSDCECPDCEAGPCNGENCPSGGCNIETGECQDLCADVTCAEGSFCFSETGACVERDIANCQSCEDETGCPDGYWCIRHFRQGREIGRYCGADCPDDQCPNTFDCIQIQRNGREVNACSPDQVSQCFECVEDNECEGDLNLCLNNACTEVQCRDTSDCEGDLECFEGSCLELTGADRSVSEWSSVEWSGAPRCDTAEDCESDEICSGIFNFRICQLPCGDNIVCPDGFSCCDPRGASDFCLPEDSNIQQVCR